MKTKGWTPERRAKRATDCKAAKPWEQSTGPKTEAGKSQSAHNSLKHGMRGKEVRELERVLAKHNQFLKDLMKGEMGK